MTMERKKEHLDSSGPKTVSKQNLEGKVFGQLTVLFVLKDEKNNTKCHCRCTCGREKDVFLSNLTSGRTQSCGCRSGSRVKPMKDISGQRFGMLTALAPTGGRRYGSILWKCRCDCGKECEVSQKDLVSGRKHSCGCVKRKRGNEPTDLTGRRFGRLVALCQTNERTAKGCVIWECRCDCGKTVNVSSDSLLTGNQRSCGCLRSEKIHEARKNLHFVDGTCLEWIEERKDRMDNTSGFKGISRRKNGRYFAKIGFQNRQYYLGTFDKIEDAVAARQKAETLLFDNFLNEYRSWEERGGKEGFHFDAEAVKASLSELRGVES